MLEKRVGKPRLDLGVVECRGILGSSNAAA
jgi:hypothetical protein